MVASLSLVDKALRLRREPWLGSEVEHDGREARQSANEVPAKPWSDEKTFEYLNGRLHLRCDVGVRSKRKYSES